MKRDISSITEGLNAAQKQAVEQIEGPSLIIAGAGSGKTRVLTSRIANILSRGHNAGSVLALTFTNKASQEMKERIADMVGRDAARHLWMGTFHSIFVRFLREYAHLLGFPSSFTIYDVSDSKSAIRNCIKDLSLDDKTYKVNEVLSRISFAKNELITAQSYIANSKIMSNDAASRKPMVGQIFDLYQKRCKQSGVMDFDDILLYTNILFRDFPDVLERMQKRFSYILVDEYQDTNFAQYLIVKKLSSVHRNICVVGDDSQSIYSFRGARIQNILSFKKDYPDAQEFRLEQNFRSTQTIVKAANSLISKNSSRLNKECFSQAEPGEKIEVVKAYTDQEEAFILASSILAKIYQKKAMYSHFAVLYRTNAQSRAVEEALRKRSLPYKLYGGHSFYERAEVKNVLAYLRLLLNPKDDEAFRRVVNVPGRGIGETTVSRLSAAAAAGGISMWEALLTGDIASFGIKSSSAVRLNEFCAMIADVATRVKEVNAYDIAMEIFIRSRYVDLIKGDISVEGQARAQNVEELFNSVKAFVEEKEAEAVAESLDSPPVAEVFLEHYLETISLMSAIDENNSEEDTNKISLMTVHSAKGLEFPYVYIIGLEENLFPSVNSFSKEEELEEERRLMYVAITRAKQSVTLSYAQTRFRWGNHVNYPPSRFLREIDPLFVNWPDRGNENRAQMSSMGFNLHPQESKRSFNPQGSRATAAHSEKPVRIAPSFSPSKPANPAFIADPVSKLRENQKVEHDRFGLGKILSIEGDPLNLKAVVDFDEGGRKILLLKYAKLRVVE